MLNQCVSIHVPDSCPSRGDAARSFGLATVRAVLAAFGERSVWSGVDSDLTVVRIDRTQPLSTTNAMVLSVREAVHKVPREVLVRAKECLDVYRLKDVEDV